VDSSGNLTENFGSAVPPNFRPDSTETIGSATVAGPIFDGSGYSFSVPSLPNHSDAVVAFDLYSVGLTSANAENQTVTVTVGDPATSAVVAITPTGATISSGPATITPVGQGQTPQGAPYSQYRVSMTMPQYSTQMRVRLVPSGYRGVIGTSLAVNDITVGVTIVPVQTFVTSLPLMVSTNTVDGATVAGAGTLETTGSSDVYTFSIPSGGQRLAINTASCPVPGTGTGLQWTLTTAIGTPASSGGCGGFDLGAVPAGDYDLTIVDPGGTGGYILDLESPHYFTATLPLAVATNQVNGTATPGAGTFQDGATQDGYNFTVPTGGEQLRVIVGSCPTTAPSAVPTWTLINAGTQAVVQHGTCSFADLGLVAGGSYTLLVTAVGAVGTYTANLEPEQAYSTTIPAIVAKDALNGTSTPGVGNFQDGARQDDFHFTAPTAGQPISLYLDSPQSGLPTWKLMDSSNTTIMVGHTGFANLGVLPAGDYRLAVTANGGIGNYTLHLDIPQVYPTTLPLSVSKDKLNGAATPGAGTFTDGAQQAVFSFTVPAGGLNLSMYSTDCMACFFTWKLLNSAGNTVANNQWGVDRLGTLPADNYQLVLSASGTVGGYVITLEQQPTQVFPVTLPLSVSKDTVNGASAPGAGNFTDGLAQSVFSFAIPMGGQNLSMNFADCMACIFSCKLVNSSGAVVANGGYGIARLGTLPAGAYQLVVAADNWTGTYTLSLEQQPTQAFPVTLPLSVSKNTVNGASASGAGNFTDGLAQHIYTFTIPNGGVSLGMIVGGCSGCSWKLVNSAGRTVSSGGAGVFRFGTVAADDYQMVFTANGSVTTYTVSLKQPPIQTFAVTLPLSVSKDTVNGASASGAGNFTDGLAQHAYSFTVPAGGMSLGMIVGGCSGCSWKLMNSAGAVVTSGSPGVSQLGTVAAGAYQVVVTANGMIGTYTVSLEQPPVLTLPVTLPLSVSKDTVNGASAPGAGNFIDGLAQHIYTFTVPPGGLNLGMIVGGSPGGWKLLNSTRGALTSGGTGTFQLGTVAGGDYQLVFTANGAVGTYTVNLEQPPIQTFATTLPLSVSKDTVNGVSAPGAGNITDGLAKQIYTFATPAGGANSTINFADCMACMFSWTLLNSAGATVSSGGYGSKPLGQLPADSYQLIVIANNTTGSYTVTVG